MSETTPISRAELRALRELAAPRSAPASATHGAPGTALVESLPDAVLACDADGVLILANRVAREWCGGDVRGLGPSAWPPVTAVDGQPLPADAAPLARALRGEEILDAEMTLAVDGQPLRRVVAHAGPLGDGEELPRGALVVMRDVTELRRVEEELRRVTEAADARLAAQREEHRRQHVALRGVVDSVASPLFTLDRDYRYTSFNRSHAAVMAALYGGEIALGQRLLDAMTVAEDRATAKANLDRALAGEAHTEEAFSGPDGPGRQYYRVSHSPLRDDAGAVAGVVVLAQDLTARRTAELALAESERRYRDVFDHLIDGLHLQEVLEDGRFRTLEMNPALERMTGIPRSLAVGKTADEVVPPQVARVVNAKWRRCVSEGRPTQETVVLDLPVGRRHFHSVLVPKHAPDGHIHRLVGITRDITDQVRRETIDAARIRLAQLATAASLDALLAAALDEAEKLAKSRAAFFHFVEDDQRLLRLQSWSARVMSEADAAPGRGRYYPLSEAGRVAECVRAGEPRLWNDPAAPHQPRLPEGGVALGRELIFPVVRAGRVRAVLGLGGKATDYTADDVDAVRLIADLAWEAAVRKRAEAEVARANRSLRMLSDSNQALVRLHDEPTLFDEICRVVVEVGGYRMARVDLPGPTGVLERRARATAEADPGHAEDRAGTDPTPAEEALRSGLLHLARRDQGATVTGWGNDALGCQCDAVLAMPLTADGLTFGTLEVHSAGRDAFDGEEIAILGELAVNLAHGITGLRARARRDQALEDLNLSERRYQDLIVRIHAAVILHAPDGRIVLANPRAQELLGLSQEELAGRETTDPRWHFLREDGSRMPLEEYPVERVRATGEALSGLVVGIRPPDGSQPVWAISSASPEVDATGTLIGVIVTFTDITDRRNAERKLEATAKRLNEAQRIAHIGSWELDLETNTLQWSAEIYRIFEIPPNRFEASYEAFINAVHPEDRARVDAAYQRSLQTREPYSVDHRLLLRGGRVRHVHEQCETFFDGDRPLRSVGTVQDVTDRKQAEAALRERESFIRTILDSVDEGFIVIDRELRIIAANRAYCESVGRAEPAVLGHHCHEVGHSLAHPCFTIGEVCPVWKTFNSGVAHRGAHIHVTPDGEERHIELRAYPITDASGAVISAIETLTDVTERRQLEEQLHQAQKMEAIGTLAGGVAHDFNNLLTGIIGYGSVLRSELAPDDPRQSSLSEILDAADRAAQLTRGLLAFSRKQVINPKPVDLRDIVRNVEKLLRRVIGEDIDLTTTLRGGDMMVMADSGQVEQVLMNLATNARDAMPEGGSLSIGVRAATFASDDDVPIADMPPGRYAELTVTDSGGGMSETTRAKAFEPFFTTKDVGRGTGLGLAIVFGIVKQHGGYIDVQSELGEGTTFKVFFPVIDVVAEEARAEVLPPPPRGRETVLLAEDDAKVRTLLRTLLARYGYRVIDAADGAEALSAFTDHANAVDVLILDVVLPKLSGRDVYDAIKAQRPDIPALFISGYTADIIHKKGILDEGLHFVAKPLDPFALLRRLRLILDAPR
ncbi:MAG: PAS domain S-box protein [Deltaproteobacteria bacterium]|nr:MAG: PAS domain S-box protein [Deltaproteobacteria bacterium]